jgi:hypothetical protein
VLVNVETLIPNRTSRATHGLSSRFTARRRALSTVSYAFLPPSHTPTSIMKFMSLALLSLTALVSARSVLRVVEEFDGLTGSVLPRADDLKATPVRRR